MHYNDNDLRRLVSRDRLDELVRDARRVSEPEELRPARPRRRRAASEVLSRLPLARRSASQA
jgi:hypothetical protein